MSALAFAWISDKLRTRAPFVVIQSFLTLLGVVLTAYGPNNGSRYLGTFQQNVRVTTAVAV
jgi:hypothetical protein